MGEIETVEDFWGLLINKPFLLNVCHYIPSLQTFPFFNVILILILNIFGAASFLPGGYSSCNNSSAPRPRRQPKTPNSPITGRERKWADYLAVSEHIICVPPPRGRVCLQSWPSPKWSFFNWNCRVQRKKCILPITSFFFIYCPAPLV